MLIRRKGIQVSIWRSPSNGGRLSVNVRRWCQCLLSRVRVLIPFVVLLKGVNSKVGFES